MILENWRKDVGFGVRRPQLALSPCWTGAHSGLMLLLCSPAVLDGALGKALGQHKLDPAAVQLFPTGTRVAGGGLGGGPCSSN